MITQDQVMKLFVYSDDGKLYWKNKTGKSCALGSEAGSKHERYYVVQIYNKKYKLHRIIFLYHHGYLPDVVDHIDGDSFNNKIENLRPTNQTGNCRNRRKQNNNSSGYTGVSWDKNKNKWKAYASEKNRYVHLGFFDDKEIAYKTVLNHKRTYYGEFFRES